MMSQPRYQKGDKIGERYLVHQALMGGMAEVYLCLDLGTYRPFALKTFRRGHPAHFKLRKFFSDEVKVWIALEKHPNIVQCHLVENIENQLFTILEWVGGDEQHGPELRSWLKTGHLDLRLALEFTTDICRGLYHADQKHPSIVHRDLKPDNVLVSESRTAKITDWGLATTAEYNDSNVGRDPDPERTGGTPLYMAPEQWRHEELDVRTDLYAVGCILYELLVGHPPFDAASLADLRRQHLEAAIPKLTNSTLPFEINAVVERCLAKDPAERFPTAKALFSELSFLYERRFDQSLPSITSNESSVLEEECFNRGNSYLELKRFQNAVDDYTRALTLKQSAHTYTNRGRALLELDRIDDALNDFNQAVELDPSFAKAYCYRGNVYNRQGRYEEALVEIGRAIEIEPTDSNAYLIRASVYEQLGLLGYRDAIADYTHALDLHPDNARSLILRGVILTRIGEHKQALTDYQRAIEIDPNLTDELLFYHRGLSHGAVGLNEEALADFTRVLESNPNNAMAYYHRGVVYGHLGNTDAQVNDYLEAVRLKVQDPKPYLEAADILEKRDGIFLSGAPILRLKAAEVTGSRAALHEVDESLKRMKRFSGQATPSEEVVSVQEYMHRAMVQVEHGQYEDAICSYTLALAEEDLPELYYRRGLVHYLIDQSNEALADLTHAVKFELPVTDKADAYYIIGNLYTSERSVNEALAAYEKSAQLGHKPSVEKSEWIRYLMSMGGEEGLRTIFEVFYRLGSFEDARIAVEQNPAIVKPRILDGLAKYVAENISPKDKALFEQRLHWLRDIARGQRQEPIEGYSPTWPEIFEQVNSVEDMREAIAQYPWLNDPHLMELVETVVRGIVPELRRNYGQRLVWLRQLTSGVDGDPQLDEDPFEEQEAAQLPTLIALATTNRPEFVTLDYIADQEKAVPAEQFAAAIADYSQIISENPKQANIYFERGEIYYGLSNFEAAMADYSRAIEIDPNMSIAYSKRGYIRQELGRIEEAQEDYTRALELDPADKLARIHRAYNYNILGRYDEAIADSSETIILEPDLASGYLNRGTSYHGLGLYQEALTDLNRAVELDPHLLLTYAYRAVVYSCIGRYDDAFRDFETAIQDYANVAPIYVHRAAVYRSLARYDDALVDLNQALKLDPALSVAYLNRGDIYSCLGRLAEALKDYRSGLKLEPGNAAASLRAGLLSAALGRVQESIPYLERAAALGDSQSAEYLVYAREQTGKAPPMPLKMQQSMENFLTAFSLEDMRSAMRRHAMMRQKEFIMSIELAERHQAPSYMRPMLRQRLVWLRQVLAEDQDNSGAALDVASIKHPLTPPANTDQDLKVFEYLNQARNAFAEMDYQTAIEQYNFAIAQDPERATTYAERAGLYDELERFEEALVDYDLAITLEPTRAVFYSDRAITYRKMKRLVEALADYSRALELDPTMAPAYANRGTLYEKSDRLDEALIDFSRAIDLDSSYMYAYYNRGIVYERMKRLHEAIADYTSAIELDPHMAPAYVMRGSLYYEIGKIGEAMSDLTRAIHLDPTDGLAYGKRALAYSVLENYDNAIADLTQFIEITGIPEGYFNRGIAYIQLKHYHEALQDFSQVIHLDPTVAAAYANRGDILSTLGNHDEAIIDYNRAIALAPRMVSAYFNAGKMLNEIGRLREALPYLERASELGNREAAELLSDLRNKSRTKLTIGGVFNKLFSRRGQKVASSATSTVRRPSIALGTQDRMPTKGKGDAKGSHVQTKIYSDLTFSIDYYRADHDDGFDGMSFLAACYQVMTQLEGRMGMQMRSDPFYFTQCDKCHRFIVTNRRIDDELTCQRCGHSNRSNPNSDPDLNTLAARINTIYKAAFKR